MGLLVGNREQPMYSIEGLGFDETFSYWSMGIIGLDETELSSAGLFSKGMMTSGIEKEVR